MKDSIPLFTPEFICLGIGVSEIWDVMTRNSGSVIGPCNCAWAYSILHADMLEFSSTKDDKINEMAATETIKNQFVSKYPNYWYGKKFSNTL